MSPETTSASKDTSKLTVARPIPDDPPAGMSVLPVSQILLDQKHVPVMMTTLFLKPARSESWIWNSVMLEKKSSRVDDWRFEEIVRKERDPLAF
jgi:hypothetical protein